MKLNFCQISACLGLSLQLIAAEPLNCHKGLVQGDPSSTYLAPIFNAPGAIDIQGRCSSVSGFASASFLYWQVSQDGLGLATNAVFSGVTSYVPTEVISVGVPFDFNPGFKVCLGLVAQREWKLYSQYTWLRGTNSTSQTPPNFSTISGVSTTVIATGTPVWSSDDWFRQSTASGQFLVGSNIQGKWTYALDILDLMTSRASYLGDRLIVAPEIGLRALWIRQKMEVDLTIPAFLYVGGGGLALSSPSQPIQSITRSQCWALGPRIGFDASCLLPQGFKIMADAAASVVYTNYTKLIHRENPASTGFNAGPYILQDEVPAGALRPIGEIGMGLGWNRYYCDQKYHFDFAATYDFTILWNQNMMRKILDSSIAGMNPSETDMYIQGLTLTGALDF